jgi:hypothetical protein
MRIANSLSLIMVLGLSTILFSPARAQLATNQELKEPTAFSGISDIANRSRALFLEAAKVIMGPRCMNCHPNGDTPTQGNDMHPHMPPVARGEGGVGVAGNTCIACHTDRNFTLAEHASYRSIPGHIRWGMAPIEMAWQGRSVEEICRQLKDPNRNGGRSLALLQEHVANDDLVAWGWQPGEGRDPAPGTQRLLGALIQAWIDTGSECP